MTSYTFTDDDWCPRMLKSPDAMKIIAEKFNTRERKFMLYVSTTRTKAGWVGQVFQQQGERVSQVRLDPIIWESEPVLDDDVDGEGVVRRSAQQLAQDLAQARINEVFTNLFASEGSA